MKSTERSFNKTSLVNKYFIEQEISFLLNVNTVVINVYCVVINIDGNINV